jgi:methylmalonyl-CoA mutase N-terminal domain/subunit
VALRTQQILAHESGVATTVDPLGGSYYVEALTDEIEREALDYIARIDAMGGMTGAIEAGYVQTEIQQAAYRYAREVEEQRRIIVGVNKFQTQDSPPEELLSVDRAVQDTQIRSLRAVRAQRSQTEVADRLARLKIAAEGTENLMVPILEAVRAYASVGEICDTLRSVFGEYREHIVI